MSIEDARTLVIVEDDVVFARALQRSFERRGYKVWRAASTEMLSALLESQGFQYAVVDLKLGTSSGLGCVQQLHRADAATRIVVLTGFASISTAVEAIKLGACYYLPKPSNTDDIEAAFAHEAGNPSAPIDGRPTSLKNLEWERINQTLADTGFNISETARRLGLHRRTLARKLAKRRLT